MQVCGLVQGTYIVTEDAPERYAPMELRVNGVRQDYAQAVCPFYWEPGRPEPAIVFKNAGGAVLQPSQRSDTGA